MVEPSCSQSSKVFFLVFSGRLWTSAVFPLQNYADNIIRSHIISFETFDLPSGEGVLSYNSYGSAVCLLEEL